jgi:hypothetical protein
MKNCLLVSVVGKPLLDCSVTSHKTVTLQLKVIRGSSPVHVGFEFYLLKTPCSPLKVNRSFGRTCRLHFQGWTTKAFSWCLLHAGFLLGKISVNLKALSAGNKGNYENAWGNGNVIDL